jgi:uncharacterized membrane protein YfcA
VAVVYGTLSLTVSMRSEQGQQMSAWTSPRLAGLLSGAIGTTFGALASLFIAMHFDAIRMPKVYFRATMSMVLVVIGLLRGLGYFAIGEFRRDVLLILLITLPMALIGIFVGVRLQTWAMPIEPETSSTGCEITVQPNRKISPACGV